MGSYLFAAQNLSQSERTDIEDLFKKRSKDTSPSVYSSNEFFMVSSRDNIDQGKLKIAFNGYLLDVERPYETVISEKYRKYGDKFVKKLKGQFRCIIYDTEEEKFHLSMDKAGQKVMYRVKKNKLIASSHLTPLLRPETVENDLSMKGLSHILQSWSSSFSGGERLIQDVKRVYPSHIEVFKNGSFHIEKYWKLQNIGERNVSDKEAINKNQELLEESTRKLVEQCEDQINLFLSKGLDSSLSLALLSKYADTTINTYTWGWVSEERRDVSEIDGAKEMAARYGVNNEVINNKYEFPEDQKIWKNEEPLITLERYPFRELNDRRGVSNYWSGLTSGVVFPVLKNFRKLNNFKKLSYYIRKAPTVQIKRLTGKIDYRIPKALEILENEKYATSILIDWAIPRHHAQKLVLENLKDFNPGEKLESKFKRKKMSFQQRHNYLQFRVRDTPRWAFYSQDLEHFDIFGFEPLIEYNFSLPMNQRKNRRLLQKVAENYNVPEEVISTGSSGYSAVSDNMAETIELNWDNYREEIEDFINRGFVNPDYARKVLLDRDFSKGQGIVSQMMTVYLLERWIKIFIDREEPWREPK